MEPRTSTWAAHGAAVTPCSPQRSPNAGAAAPAVPRRGQAVICSAWLSGRPSCPNLPLPSLSPCPGPPCAPQPAQMLPWETTRRLPKRKKKDRKPKFGFSRITALTAGQGLDQHRFGCLHCSNPLGFPTSRMLLGSPKVLSQRACAKRDFPPLGTGFLGSRLRGAGRRLGWWWGHQGAADSISKGDRILPAEPGGRSCCQAGCASPPEPRGW